MTDVNELAKGVDEVTTRLSELWHLDGPDDLNGKLALLAAAREMVEAAKVIVDFCEVDCIANVPTRKHPVEGGTWETSSGSRREFREHESLLGRIRDVTDDDVPELLHAIAKCLPASVGWKVGALTELGVEANDYCEWKQGRKTLRFVPSKDVGDGVDEYLRPSI